MKKVFVVIALVSIASWTLTSCGGSKKETETEETKDEAEAPELAEPKTDSADDLIKQGQALVDASDCKTCHHPTNKIVGPSHTDVAKKYEFTKANVSMLADKIINGGSGNWGEIPMSPHADLSKGDAEKMAMYVLSLSGNKPKD
ncbi:c-type cytochrome [Chryseolinea lacunae]|uniref:Cytochrome C n=1 Tax=Chryseolinea lacunae TaxID=2801331 RepID=A0ABS1KWG5_9BACT|nr:c-type cytochrome [Chryseolinea lacunae]MBL0743648.1 cytochrome C [Chryseolinea lacunae]